MFHSNVSSLLTFIGNYLRTLLVVITLLNIASTNLPIDVKMGLASRLWFRTDANWSFILQTPF